MIFDPNFYPVNTSVGFIKRPMNVVAEFQIGWDQRVYDKLNIEDAVKYSMNTTKELVDSLFPLTMPQVTRVLMIEPAEGWTIYLNNSANGTDLSGLSYIAQQLEATAVRATSVLISRDIGFEINSPHAGSTCLEIYKFDNIENPEKRIIRSINEDGAWAFETEGNPLAFEDVSAYSRKKIKDRFNKDLLLHYLTLAGVPFQTNDSILYPACLIERAGWKISINKEFSREQALLR